jgi:hypothetical protein
MSSTRPRKPDTRGLHPAAKVVVRRATHHPEAHGRHPSAQLGEHGTGEELYGVPVRKPVHTPNEQDSHPIVGGRCLVTVNIHRVGHYCHRYPGAHLLEQFGVVARNRPDRIDSTVCGHFPPAQLPQLVGRVGPLEGLPLHVQIAPPDDLDDIVVVQHHRDPHDVTEVLKIVCVVPHYEIKLSLSQPPAHLLLQRH